MMPAYLYTHQDCYAGTGQCFIPRWRANLLAYLDEKLDPIGIPRFNSYENNRLETWSHEAESKIPLVPLNLMPGR